jgi:hypothetical protein
MNSPDIPVPQHGFFVSHFLTVSDQAKSREYDTGKIHIVIDKAEWEEITRRQSSSVDCFLRLLAPGYRQVVRPPT